MRKFLNRLMDVVPHGVRLAAAVVLASSAAFGAEEIDAIDFNDFSVNLFPVPEPAGAGLMAFAFAAFAVRTRR